MQTRPKFKQFLWSLVVVVAVGLAGLVAQADGGSGQLVGAWDAVTDDGSSFLLSFHHDHTFNGSQPLANVSVSHGAWKQVGGEYLAHAEALVYGSGGTVEARQEADAVLNVDGSTMTAEVTLAIYDLNGGLLQSITQSATGTRITVD